MIRRPPRSALFPTRRSSDLDGTDWGTGATLHVSVGANHAPVLSASDVTAIKGQSIAASNLFSVTDADGDQMNTYAFIDNTSGASSGHFVFNGVTEPSGQYFLVPQALFF